MKDKTEKQNRFEETRYFETRDYDQYDDEIRRNIEMSWRDPHYVDPSIIPEGMVYSWKREYIHKFGGDEDKGRIPECMRKGWRPVPAERHPELVSLDTSGNSHKKGYIERGGLILFERPKRYNDLEFEQINRSTYEQIHSNEALRGNSPFMNINRNVVSFGTY
jgi:hypothetical protein